MRLFSYFYGFSKVPTFSHILLFQGIVSFESTNLSYFRPILNLFVNCPMVTLICVECWSIFEFLFICKRSWDAFLLVYKIILIDTSFNKAINKVENKKNNKCNKWSKKGVEGGLLIVFINAFTTIFPFFWNNIFFFL